MYAWGIVFALLAGFASQAGHICQKLVVNEEATGAPGGFFSRLLRRPLWLTGLALQIGVSTVFFLLAQVRLGPTLIPGLMATGLIVLAAGSAWIVRERLGFGEILGIAMLIAAAGLLGRSRLAIDLGSYDVLDRAFLGRAALFSAAAAVLFFALGRPQGRRAETRHALRSGLLYVLSNFWVGPFMAAVLRLLRGELGLPVWAMFAFGSAVLVLTNLFGIAEMQRAFRVGRAAVAVPLQTVPTQLAPALVYLAVFRLRPPSPGAVWLFGLGTLLVVASTFLLDGRGVRSPAAPPRTPGRSSGEWLRGSRARRRPAPEE